MHANRSVKYQPDVDRPTDEEVRAYLGVLLGHADFNASERNKRFLTYVVEETLGGRADRIKAYNIALSAFNRSEDFDPLTDPIVRIEARRLRTSLERYYLTAGVTDRIRIEIPKGSYVATFAYCDPAGSKSETAAEKSSSSLSELPSPIAGKRRKRKMLAALLAASAMIAVGAFAFESRNGVHGETVALSANQLSIAVLPFEDLGRDPTLAFVARGLTYDLIVRLTQLREVTVFSSDSGPGAARANQALARSSYTLFGSVQPEANKIRVIAILADSRTGQSLKSWNFERDLEQTSYRDLQSDIAEQIVSAVSGMCAAGSRGSDSETPLGQMRFYDCRHLTRVAAN